MMDLNPETRSKTWTKDIVEEAKNHDLLAPVVIISYKRGGEAQSIKLLKNSGVKVFLFVYDDDYENYRSAVESSNNIEVVLCPSALFRGAAKKRDFVQETMYNKGFEDYFVLDDDISMLYHTEEGKTKLGKYKAQKIETDPLSFFKTWHYTIHNLIDYEVTLGGIIPEFISWSQDLYKIPVSNKTGRVCQIVYINAKKFHDYNIKYTEVKAWDDFDVMLQVLNLGLNLSIIPWLTYSGDTMTPKKSVASGGDFTWTKKSMRLYQKWGECVGFKADKGQLNTTINWSKIKKDLKILGRLNPTFKEEWDKYFSLEPTEENPYGLDYLGFTELWRPKIDEWIEKHSPKSQKKEEPIKLIGKDGEELTKSEFVNEVVDMVKENITPSDREVLENNV